MEHQAVHYSVIFSLFYILSFLTVLAVIIIFSLRKGYPLRSVMLMLTTISLMTVLGSRLFTIPVSSWIDIFRPAGSEYHDRSAIGGLLFGIIGLMISQKYFGFGRPILNFYAVITPVALGIQKFGCFFNGCCYGKPTTLPWGVNYGSGAPAHFEQMGAGLISPDSVSSLAVHPVQIYEALMFFIIGFIVFKSLKKWNKSGSALVFSLTLFLLMRFGMEFLRDPAGSAFNNHYFLGVRVFVWGILASAILIGTMLFLYEWRMRKDPLKARSKSPGFNAHIIFILAVSFLLFLLKDFLTPFEITSVEIRFVPAVFLSLVYLLKSSPAIRYRLAKGFILILPFLLMSQSTPEDTVKIIKYNRIDAGTSFGSAYNTLRYNPHQGECGNTYTRENYRHTYGIGGIGYSQVMQKGKLTRTMGINLYGGPNEEYNMTENYTTPCIIGGINPYFKNDWRWFGFGLGAHLGNIRWIPSDNIDERYFDRGTRFSPILPEFYFRAGRRDIVDIRYSYGFAFPSPFPAMTMETSIGSGFGLSEDHSLRVGVHFPTGELYFSAEGLIKQVYGFKLIVLAGGYYVSNYDGKTPARLAFGLNYRFGHQKL